LDKLRTIKQDRDNNKVKQSLSEIQRVANSDENLMPVILEAVKHYTTLGEICDILRGVYGVYEPGTFF
ncbi:MAG: methylmalonyl-CoA mutase, partial [Thermoplasmata archaeon]|nr:methylmalonyl-CoA mutase [Thermoplasmata archaeon]